jgi:hypothetical protein
MQPVRSLPNYSRRLSDGCHFLEGGGSRRRDNSCWRGSWREGRGAEPSTAIHPRRPVAEREAVGAGVRWGRRPVAERGAAQRYRIGTHNGSLCWRGGGHSLPGAAASGRRCGKLGFRRDGELRDRARSGLSRTGEGSLATLPRQRQQTAPRKALVRNVRKNSMDRTDLSLDTGCLKAAVAGAQEYPSAFSSRFEYIKVHTHS